jgi:Polyphosphate kinase 2 (PPK2)
MKTNRVIEGSRRFSKPYRVTDGKKFRLEDVDPGDTGELKSADKSRAKEALQSGVQALAELQDVLQQKRFLERLDNPDKNWKFSANDAKEREFWKDYMEAYEETIRETATEDSPWYVVPADNKWFTRVVVAAAVIDTLASLNLHYPEVSAAKRQELTVAREALFANK